MDYDKMVSLFFEETTANEDNVRRYAVAAFRFYALCGKPTYEEAVDVIKDNALVKGADYISYVKNGVSKPTENAFINIERVLEDKSSTLGDILAVEETLKILRGRRNGNEIIKALEYVYFVSPDVKMDKGDIALRVAGASINIPASERQIYYWLKEARLVFCRARGLRF